LCQSNPDRRLFSWKDQLNGIGRSRAFPASEGIFASQQFRGALTDSFRSLTPQEAAVIEEELEQGRTVRSQMATEEKIVAEPAVGVLAHRTGPGRTLYQFGDDRAYLEETAAQSLSPRGLARPARGGIPMEGLDDEHLAQRGDRKLELDF